MGYSYQGVGQTLVTHLDSAALQYYQKLKNFDPVCYWPIWDAVGAATIEELVAAVGADYSGVTLGQAGIGDGRTCGAFDGSGSDYIDIYDAINSVFSATAGSISIWVRLAADVWTDGTERYFINIYAGSSNRVYIKRLTTNNLIEFHYRAGGTGKTVTYDTSVTAWLHLVITWDKNAGETGEVKAYVAGSQTGTTQTSLGTWAAALVDGYCLIGAFRNNGSSVHSGLVAHAAVWDRALTAPEVAKLANFFNLHPETGDATNAASYETTPTSTGTGAATHPDVVYNADGWNGYKYWMVMTPYPGTTVENPEILASNDGDTWVVPDGLTNPIDPNPGGTTNYNSDPDLIFGQDSNLYCFYREKDDTSGSSTIQMRSSSDGINWSEESSIIGPDAVVKLSPAVVWNGSQYEMFVIDGSSPTRIVRRTADDLAGSWSNPVNCLIYQYPMGKEPWHINVYKEIGRYIGLLTMRDVSDATLASCRLYLALSIDGWFWQIASTPLLDVAVGSWDDERIYRSAFLPRTGSGYDLWYSARNSGGSWHIGKTVITGI